MAGGRTNNFFGPSKWSSVNEKRRTKRLDRENSNNIRYGSEGGFGRLVDEMPGQLYTPPTGRPAPLLLHIPKQDLAVQVVIPVQVCERKRKKRKLSAEPVRVPFFFLVPIFSLLDFLLRKRRRPFS